MSKTTYKVLVANRGEIAIRILRSARELGWATVAVYTESDRSHAGFADETVRLEDVAVFMNPSAIAAIAHQTRSSHVHPGYGFLSENPALYDALARCTPPISFIGPSPETLRIASDKMLSRELAASLNINISPGTRVSSASDVLTFAQEAGYPVMIKALDGGGGRGIRIALKPEDVGEAFKRCLGESPSKQVFSETALIGNGWNHVEIQLIGDGTGAVNHFWERECSVQRRFQKIVEMAPSRLARTAVQPLVDASCSIARSLRYKGLGTFEFLVNALTKSWVFLEINPRVQVEHTVTEEVVDMDLVRAQLLLFTPGTTLRSLSLHTIPPPPACFAIQLRLTAEDPAKNFQLSPGSIHPSDITWPAGRGVRVDTWLCASPNAPQDEWTVGTDFDSLLAKVIVRGKTFEETTQKAVRALQEFSLAGNVKTNVQVLSGVVGHPNWEEGLVDTLWLERTLEGVLETGEHMLRVEPTKGLELEQSTHSKAPVPQFRGSGPTTLQPGTLFNLTLLAHGENASEAKHSVMLSSIKQNAFPDILSGTLQTSLAPTPLAFTLTQSASASVAGAGGFELADPNNRSHIGCPLSGKVVELHPALHSEKGGAVKKGEPVIVLSVMKMETTVVAPRDGYVKRTGKGINVGKILGEGSLVCVLEENEFTSKL